MTRDFSAIPYREAANWSRGILPGPKRLITLHCMEYPKKPDSAEWCAGFFADQPHHATHKPGEVCRCSSAHACADSDSIIQCVPWDRIAWHAPGANRYGIGIEHAGYGRNTLADWQDTYSTMMLDGSAWLVSELCRRNAIPVDFLDANELSALKDRATGITTHWEVSKAFHLSNHVDPGPSFPIGNYLRQVERYSAASLNA
jgi:N-acetyl-anhydromuramyl-L-alanine amidase AmpD